MWKLLRFPAEADNLGGDPTGRPPGQLLTPRLAPELVEAVKTHDPHIFRAMFQGVPTLPEGNVFKREWFKTITEEPQNVRWVRYWDLAASTKSAGDYTVGAKVAQLPTGSLCIADIVRIKAEWPEASELIVRTAEMDGKSVFVGIESVGMQLALIQSIAREQVFKQTPLIPCPVDRDKLSAAYAWARVAKWYGVFLVKGNYIGTLMDELMAFSGMSGGHDDQVDAISGAYSLLVREALVPHKVDSEPYYLSYAGLAKIRDQQKRERELETYELT